MLDWNAIDTVLLDMDGTLLDLNFDAYFWRELVPRRYAESRGLDLATARQILAPRFHKAQGTLDWYCLDYWSRELGLDIALMKQETAEFIAVLPYALEFLDAVRATGKRAVLVTNAHQRSLALKLEHTRLGDHLDAIVCAHDLGLPKEDEAFWARLRTTEPYDPAHTLLIDDNLDVLRSARRYGIAHILAAARPNSHEPPCATAEFPALIGFHEILPRA